MRKNAFVEINGGEPLIKKGLVQKIIPELKKYFYSVTLNTNDFLINETRIDKLEKSGLNFVKASLYSLDEKIHDDLRQIPGSGRRAKRVVDLTAESKIKCEVGILITDKNIR